MKKVFLFCCVIFFLGCRPRQLFQVQLTIVDATITNEHLDSTVMTLKRRLDLLKDEKAAIRVDRRNKQIAIETFSIKNESDAVYFVSAGRVEFSECYTVGEIYPMLQKAAASLKRDSTENRTDREISDLLAGIQAPENLLDMLITNRTGSSYTENAAELGFLRQANRGKLDKLLSRTAPYYPGNIKFLFGRPDFPSVGSNDSVLAVYAIKTNPDYELGNSCVETVQVNTDHMGKPVIDVNFNRTGAYRWRLMTKMNINRPIVISVDGQVYSAPIVLSEISGGKAIISGGFTVQQAAALANAISSGELPLRLKFKSIRKLWWNTNNGSGA
jgi:hypothetical protein